MLYPYPREPFIIIYFLVSLTKEFWQLWVSKLKRVVVCAFFELYTYTPPGRKSSISAKQMLQGVGDGIVWYCCKYLVTGHYLMIQANRNHLTARNLNRNLWTSR